MTVASETLLRSRRPNSARPRAGLSRLQRSAILVAGALVALLTWELVWAATDFLPSPGSTAHEAIRLVAEPDTYVNIGATARRLVIGLAMGYVSAFLVAVLMQRSRLFSGIMSPYVMLAITFPSMVISLICLMVFGLAEFGVCMSVAVVIFPFVVLGVSEGVAALDPKQAQMTQIYGYSRLMDLRDRILPGMAPFMFSSFRNVHAIAWKIVAIAELFSQQIGIGAQYKRAYGYFELERLVVWTFFFIVLVVCVEYLMLKPLERRVFRWRSTTQASINQHRRPTAA